MQKMNETKLNRYKKNGDKMNRCKNKIMVKFNN